MADVQKYPEADMHEHQCRQGNGTHTHLSVWKEKQYRSKKFDEENKVCKYRRDDNIISEDVSGARCKAVSMQRNIHDLAVRNSILSGFEKSAEEINVKSLEKKTNGGDGKNAAIFGKVAP